MNIFSCKFNILNRLLPMQPYFCVRQIIGNQSRMDRMCEACAKDPHCADSYIYDYTVILY